MTNESRVVNEAHEPHLPDEGSHPQLVARLDAHAALDRLRAGNAAYLRATRNSGDISSEVIHRLAEQGQAPFACVVACADSRVVPEHIFMTGLGELFCIRAAGNALGSMGLASCLYAVEHLGVKLVLVLGHTHCGAIEAGMDYLRTHRELGSVAADESLPAAIRPLARHIVDAIGSERDPYRAAELNIRACMTQLRSDPDLAALMQAGVEVQGALYHTHTGEVEFLPA